MTSTRSLIALVAGAVMISTAAPLVRAADIGATASAFYRLAFGACFLAPIILWRWRDTRLPTVPVVLAAAFFALDLWLWHRSIPLVGPGLATILANFQVFFLAAIGAVLFAEHLSWRFWSGAMLALFGLSILLVLGEDGSFERKYLLGVSLGLATAVAYCGFTISLRSAQRKTGDRGRFNNLFWVSLLGAAVLLATALSEGESLAIPDQKTLAFLVALGLVPQVIGWSLIAYGMRTLDAGLIGLILLLQPGLAFVWDVIFFDRAAGPFDVLGAALALAGIYAGLTRAKPGAQSR